MRIARTQRFHVTREARRRYRIGGPLLGRRGDLVVSDPIAIRRLAAAMNLARAEGEVSGPPTVAGGELLALGLLHEVFHAVVERYETAVRPGLLADSLAAAEDALEPGPVRAALDAFAERFSGGDPAATPAEERDRLVALLEELLLTRVANENPAAEPYLELIDDRPLAELPAHRALVAEVERRMAAEPGIGPGDQTLLELLRAPARATPTSLSGQLRYVRTHWRDLVGDLLDGILVAIDILSEEERALHLRFGGGGLGGRAGGTAPAAKPPSYAGLDAETERFSADADWMPRVVMLAKSTYVWLDQLGRRHGRDIRTLDAVPDEELDRLAAWGVTGLWLIGLWQRSRASERIKRRRGNPDAVASAYSLDDYQIAEDLGGDAAWADLRDRAAARGIRLASDMVPNHMGIDSSWVIEHPEWFLSLPEAPYPSYSFGGPDLSDDPRVGIFLEEHYWDSSDASVVFRRHDRATGEDRFVYHGNDGTSFPWNDTAQLDFLRADVREQVIRTIIDVARRFPIIRFDAAMVLARKHVQRLWWPAPGSGGAIPSRAEHAISVAAFDAAMPTEFWREVVDRIAVEAPGTLLLAEAFWLLEGYFVRTLGMHRVYNSAFMHMFRDEDGPGFRKLVRDTLEFDPEILKRYVNFMSNPDEETAIGQFGNGDKYFGVATVLATLPGLPMLGHGQVEGYAEKYGMEYRRATLEEAPDPWLVERHERELFPLLHRRGQFAEIDDFRLYDLVHDDGSVDEAVLAYSNGRGDSRSLIVYNLRFDAAAGTLRDWVPFADKQPDGSRPLRPGTLGAALGLPDADDVVVTWRDERAGLEHVARASEIHRRGLRVELGAYACRVFLDVREIHDGIGSWRQLADRLAGRGLPSLADALRDLELEPVHGALRAAIPAAVAGPLPGPDAERLVAALYAEIAAATGAPGPSGASQAAVEEALARLAAVGAGSAESGLAPPAVPLAAAGKPIGPIATDEPAGIAGSATPEHAEAAPAGRPPGERIVTRRCLALLEPVGHVGSGPEAGATARAAYAELRLEPVVAAALHESGLDEEAAGRVAGRLGWLLGFATPSTLGGDATATGATATAAQAAATDPAATDATDPATAATAAAIVSAWLADPAVRTALRVNHWEGVDYLDRDALREVVDWALELDRDAAASAEVVRLPALAEAAGHRVERWLELSRQPGPASPPTATTPPP